LKDISGDIFESISLGLTFEEVAVKGCAQDWRVEDCDFFVD
jgi:hypothetical protein